MRANSAFRFFAAADAGIAANCAQRLDAEVERDGGAVSTSVKVATLCAMPILTAVLASNTRPPPNLLCTSSCLIPRPRATAFSKATPNPFTMPWRWAGAVSLSGPRLFVSALFSPYPISSSLIPAASSAAESSSCNMYTPIEPVKDEGLTTISDAWAARCKLRTHKGNWIQRCLLLLPRCVDLRGQFIDPFHIPARGIDIEHDRADAWIFDCLAKGCGKRGARRSSRPAAHVEHLPVHQ